MQIAKNFKKEGREIRALVALDPIRPPAVSGRSEQTADLTVSDVADALDGVGASRRRGIRSRLGELYREMGLARKRGWRHARIQQMMYRARGRFQTDIYDDPIDLVVGRKPDRAAELQKRWDQVSSSELRRWHVEGTHYSMWMEPHIESTAHAIADILEYRDRLKRGPQ